LTVESKEGTHITLHGGDAWPEVVDTVHRGVTGDTAVEVIAFYAGTASKSPR
jgi:hypothetical protein